MNFVFDWMQNVGRRRRAVRAASQAFHTRYPGRPLLDVAAVLQEDEELYLVQVSHGPMRCPLASFWSVSKATFIAVEARSPHFRGVGSQT